MRAARAVLVVAATVTLGAGVLTSGVLTSGTHPEHDGEAVVACRQAVEAELGLPPSADRLGVPVARVTVVSTYERYVVEGRTAATGPEGSVDFRCTVAYEPGADGAVRVAEVVLA